MRRLWAWIVRKAKEPMKEHRCSHCNRHLLLGHTCSERDLKARIEELSSSREVICSLVKECLTKCCHGEEHLRRHSCNGGYCPDKGENVTCKEVVE